jgi:hypothetical protein
VPRSTLFRTIEPVDGPYVVDVVEWLERSGVAMGPILQRLGVRR